jgi:hypothetical protein
MKCRTADVPADRCPLCGGGNACAMAAGSDPLRRAGASPRTFDGELLARVPLAARGRACICAACAAAAKPARSDCDRPAAIVSAMASRSFPWRSRSEPPRQPRSDRARHERRGARRNVMAAAWSMPVEFTPPRIAVVIDKHTFTRELVVASGAFGLCLPGPTLIDLTYAVGGESGRDVDKFARTASSRSPGPRSACR